MMMIVMMKILIKWSFYDGGGDEDIDHFYDDDSGDEDIDQYDHSMMVMIEDIDHYILC